jgi:hypothetical protein
MGRPCVRAALLQDWRLEEDTPEPGWPRVVRASLIGSAESFNRLAESLERRTAERDALTRRLIDFQEEERRHLDANCMMSSPMPVAVGALAASPFTAPMTVVQHATEAGRIQQLAEPMMHSLRALLLRSAPARHRGIGLESACATCGGLNGRSRTVSSLTSRVIGRSVGTSGSEPLSRGSGMLDQRGKACGGNLRVGALEPEEPSPGDNLTVEDDARRYLARHPWLRIGLSGMRERGQPGR